jgi:hypothetical protein
MGGTGVREGEGGTGPEAEWFDSTHSFDSIQFSFPRDIRAEERDTMMHNGLMVLTCIESSLA